VTVTQGGAQGEAYGSPRGSLLKGKPAGAQGEAYGSPRGSLREPKGKPAGAQGEAYGPTGAQGEACGSHRGSLREPKGKPAGAQGEAYGSPKGSRREPKEPARAARRTKIWFGPGVDDGVSSSSTDPLGGWGVPG